MTATQALAQRLPDLPRWVETRDLLLSGECELWGLQEAPALALAVRGPGEETVFVAGRPAAEAIRAAAAELGREGSVIAPGEQVDWLAQGLPGWTPTRIIVHTLADQQRLPADTAAEYSLAAEYSRADLPQRRTGVVGVQYSRAAAGGLAVDFLDPSEIERLPIAADLLEELWRAAEYSLVAATFVHHQPVSFCYAGSETETLWDISIDTLPEHRRRGYAGLCAAHMIRHMQAKGKQPVWAAAEDNPASWRLAQKLGFVAVDELVEVRRT